MLKRRSKTQLATAYYISWLLVGASSGLMGHTITHLPSEKSCAPYQQSKCTDHNAIVVLPSRVISLDPSNVVRVMSSGSTPRSLNSATSRLMVDRSRLRKLWPQICPDHAYYKWMSHPLVYPLMRVPASQFKFKKPDFWRSVDQCCTETWNVPERFGTETFLNAFRENSRNVETST